MSVVELAWDLSRSFAKVCLGAALWTLVAPLAWLVPRRKDWLAVIGRDQGKFVDNVKYFLLQSKPLLSCGVRTVFVTERSDIADTLAKAGYETLVYPSARSVWFLLRAGTMVADSNEWAYHVRRFLLIRARLVQLWHGIGFKRIQLDKLRNEVKRGDWMSSKPVLAMRILVRTLRCRRVRYDAVNVTSRFYRDNVFVPAFSSRNFVLAGYPRNSFGGLSPAETEIAWSTVDASIREKVPHWQARKRRIVLVTPTFRDTRPTPMDLGPRNLALLDAWCDHHNVEMVFKFHPFESCVEIVKGVHLHLCAPDSDLYPLMPLSSAMITDYSSIYMDYLLLDKPILFLVPDLEEYIRSDRQIQFDFDEMTPGPKVRNWPELLTQLGNQWCADEYAHARTILRLKAFDDLPQEQATSKLIVFMRAQGWLPSGQEYPHDVHAATIAGE